MLLVDSAVGLGTWHLSRLLIRLAEGDPARAVPVLTVLGAVITLPAVFLSTYLLAVTAGHRLGDHRRRWILLGMGIYGAVRTAMVLASNPSAELVARLGPGDQEAALALLAETVTGRTPPPAATPPAVVPNIGAGSPVRPRRERR